MGLRDYEFDVAPELVAALVRGRPGPLMDAALAHIGNLAEAAREAEQSAQNARDRAMVESVEQSVAASLENLDTIVSSGVNQGGAFSVGRVGGSVGDVNRMGSDLADPTSGLGPGRNVGLLPGSKGDFGVKGVGVQDVIQGLILGGRARATIPLKELYQRLYEANNERREATRRANLYQRFQDLANDNTGSPSGDVPISTLAQLYQEAVVDQQSLMNQIATLTAQIQAALRIKYDNPEGDASNPSLDTAADAFALAKRLESLGGLGWNEGRAATGGGVRVPPILNAVNPAPDSDSSESSVGEIRHWIFELIDPVGDW